MQAPRTWRRRHWLAAIVGGLMLVVFAGYLAICARIGMGVRAQVDRARSQYAGDPVEALMALVADEGQPLKDRNDAIWALGQLADERALPLLRKLRTGRPCDHAHRVCEHELEKAIALAEGGWNAGGGVWRRGELAKKGGR